MATAKQRIKANIKLVKNFLTGQYKNKYIYVSHHKCATQYVVQIMSAISKHKNYSDIVIDWRQKASWKDLLFNNVLLVQDYSQEVIPLRFLRARGFHVIRDPRDILISTYYSHRDSHPTKEPEKGVIEEIVRDRQILPQMDMQTGLRFLMDNSSFFKRVAHEMREWNYNNPRFYETRFECLTVDPLAEFKNILQFIRLDIDDEVLSRILSEFEFKNLKQNWAKWVDPTQGNHYRSGKAGQWQQELVGDNKAYFKEKYGDLVIKLGYERDNNW